MKIELERGFINSNEDKSVQIETVARIPISELKTIGEDEAIGSLFVEFIHKMTTIDNKTEGMLTDKGLVDMLVENFDEKDYLIIGYDVKDADNIKPILVCMKDGNNEISFITKE